MRLPFYILLGVIVLPSFVMVALSQSSMAMGLVLSLVIFWLFFLTGSRSFFLDRRSCFLVLIFVFGMQAFILLHAFVLLIIGIDLNVGRFVGSYFISCFFLVSACFFGTLLAQQSETILSKYVGVALVFMVLNALIGLAGVHLFPLMSQKPVGIFSEPSHFALALAPLLIYACAAEIRFFRFFIVFFFAWALLIQNLTTLVVASLAVCVVFRLSFIRLLFLSVIFVFVFLFILGNDYFISRINITPDSENLSVLTLLRGWETAFLMLDETHKLGAGFQQFGFVDVSGPISDKMTLYGVTELNAFDGGSTGPKLVGEFGVFGFLCLFAFSLYFIKSVAYLRMKKTNSYTGGLLFCASCIIGFMIELFIRGVGYFSPGSFLFLSAVIGFASTSQKKVLN